VEVVGQGRRLQEEKAKDAVLELWRCFGEACGLQSMDFNTVKEIYIAKNRVNFERQDLHYNEDTKTEHDNQALRSRRASRIEPLCSSASKESTGPARRPS